MPTIRQISVNPNASQKTGQTPQALGLNLQWSKAAQASIKDILSRYPADRSRSATIPLLWLAQREFGGWLSVDAMQLVADTLSLPYIRVYEVASFYTMFNLAPVGKYHVQVCTNCACMIRGSDAIVEAAKKVTHIAGSGQTSDDGMFTFTEVECLGACVAAPMMQITAADGGAHFFTHLTGIKAEQILRDLAKGGKLEEHAETLPSKVDPISHGTYGD